MTKWIAVFIVLLVLGAGGFLIISKNDVRGPSNMKDTKTTTSTQSSSLVTPISHASFILSFGGQTIYNDPVGADLFKDQPTPNIILISDIHPDHLDADTLNAISQKETIIISPKAVVDKLPDNLPGKIVTLSNGEKTTQNGIEIEAIPMYNIPQSQTAFHTKGRGNGYVLSAERKRVYIAGDTAVTPEMKALKNIDEAFVPMNLPYTMSVEEAAKGVLAFKPKLVHAYHYRGQDGLSDTNKFKSLVEAGDPNIKVVLLNFYPQGK